MRNNRQGMGLSAIYQGRTGLLIVDERSEGEQGVAHTINNITTVTAPGPRWNYCDDGCYKNTRSYADIEVWDEDDRKLYRIVLRCAECDYGYDVVTEDSRPDDWHRLMKNSTARSLLKGAQSS
jgi:hypothetical protein